MIRVQGLYSSGLDNCEATFKDAWGNAGGLGDDWLPADCETVGQLLTYPQNPWFDNQRRRAWLLGITRLRRQT
jgi:hypothetical protein